MEHQPETSLAHLNRAYSEPEALTEVLQEAAQFCHLISPAASCGHLPEGFEVVVSTVLIDVDHETYSPSDAKHDERALSKTALDRIAAGVGITWDPAQTGVVSKALHYVHYRAVAVYKDFDNQSRVLPPGEGELDLRDGSGWIAKLEAQARSKGKDPQAAINEKRTHILALACTKAHLRAIRDLGVRSKYTVAELQLPFVMPRLMFTGRTSDPELRRIFAIEGMRQHMDARRALYGAPEPSRKALALPMHPPPAPIGEVDDDGDPLGCDYCGVVGGVTRQTTPKGDVLSCSDAKCCELAASDVARETAPVATRKTDPAPAPASRTEGNPYRRRANAGGASASAAPGVNHSPGAAGPPGGRRATGLKIPGRNGQDAGKPLEEASSKSLRWWADKLSNSLAQGTTDERFVASDTRLRDAMRAELQARESGAGDPLADNEMAKGWR